METDKINPSPLDNQEGFEILFEAGLGCISLAGWQQKTFLSSQASRARLYTSENHSICRWVSLQIIFLVIKILGVLPSSLHRMSKGMNGPFPFDLLTQ